ncbi:MAG: response regulator [Burkholderiales bacterium]|nr:response regulator [Burkholderiales bacterium]
MPDTNAATRVLVVDDTQDDAVTLAFELGRGLEGVETRWAEGADEMYAAIAEWQPHCVLTDVHMPRFDIFAALARIRAEWPLLPVVVVSGLVGEEVAARLIKAGANDFVAKSGLSRLAMVVERELRDARQRAEQARLEDRLRRQQSLFDRLLEHLPVGVWLSDAAGSTMYANPAALALRDGPPGAARAGYPHRRGRWAGSGAPLAPDDWPAAQALRGGRAASAERIEVDGAGGVPRVIVNSAVPLQDERGQILGYFEVDQDITGLHSTEQRLRATERMLRNLSLRLLDAQEQERRWIAQELHDDIGQGIAAMRFQLARIVEQSREDSAREMAAAALTSSQQLGDRLRQICLGLRPFELDAFGLMAGLRSVVAALAGKSGLALRLHCIGAELRYPPAIETAAFRIAQEAVGNALRHSGCGAIELRVEMAPQRLVVTVEDDGSGFDVAAATTAEAGAGHLGLAGMDERARAAGGRLALQSRPGAGTTVEALFELDAPKPPAPAATPR